mmetsp:Transcript_12746/g.21811  ORF Transcript_12746/g.21811 Transcript_12746/m.21811 type:complete len:333 (-) Transcript_12746:76-1074(-)
MDTMDIYSIMKQVFSSQESISWLMYSDEVDDDNRYGYQEINLIPSSASAKPEARFSSPISLTSLNSSYVAGDVVSGKPSLAHQEACQHPSDLELKFESGDSIKCLASTSREQSRVILQTDDNLGLLISVSTKAKERGMVSLTCFWCSSINDHIVPMTKCNILLEPADPNRPSASDIVEYSISHGRIQCDHLHDQIVHACDCTNQAIRLNDNGILEMNRDPWALWLKLKSQTSQTKKGKRLSPSSLSDDFPMVLFYLKEIDAMPMSQPERFSCKLCSATFSRKYDLKRHVHTKHLPEKRDFACEFCSSKFKRREHLSVHYAHIHQKSSTVSTS